MKKIILLNLLICSIIGYGQDYTLFKGGPNIEVTNNKPTTNGCVNVKSGKQIRGTTYDDSYFYKYEGITLKTIQITATTAGSFTIDGIRRRRRTGTVCTNSSTSCSCPGTTIGNQGTLDEGDFDDNGEDVVFQVIDFNWNVNRITGCSNAETFDLRDFMIFYDNNVTFSGSGVFNQSFIPSSAGPGEHIVTATRVFDNGTATKSIIVDVLATYDDQVSSLGDMWIEDDLAYCSDDDAVNLTSLVQFNKTTDQFTWNGGSGNSFDPTVYPNVTEIIYTYTNSNNCTTDHPISVDVDPAFTVNIGSNPTQYCIDDIYSLNATPSNGNWFSVSGGISGNTFIAKEAGVGAHTLVYTAQQGTCTREATLNINVFALPPVETGGDLEFCNNTGGDQSLVRTNTFPQSAGIWSIIGNSAVNSRINNANQTVDIDGLANGEYVLKLEFTNDNNCYNADTAIIKIQDVLNAPIVSESFSCEPSQITMQIAQPQNNVIYKWYDDTTSAPVFQPGSSFLTPFINVSTKYWVSVENEFGCESSFREVIAEVREPIAPDPGNNEQVCFNGDDLVLTGFSPLGGVFSSPNVEQTGTNQWVFNVAGLSSGGYNMTYTVLTNGCQASATKQVTVREPVAVDAGINAIVCFGGSVDLNGINTFPSGGTWSFVNPNLNNLIDGSIVDASVLEVSQTGYPVIYRATDPATGCENVDQKLLEVRALPENPIVQTDINCGPSFAALVISNHDGNNEYLWYDDQFENNLLQEGNFNRYNTPTRLDSSASFYVKSVNRAGCESDLVEANAIINELPFIQVQNDVVCLNNNTYDLFQLVNPKGGIFLNAEINNTVNNIQFPNSLGEGSYVFNYRVESNAGCKKTLPFQITIVSSLAGNLLPEDTSYCRSVAPFSLSEWAGLFDGTFSGPGVEGNFITLNNVVDPDNRITISYEENDNGCVFRDEVNITILSSPEIPTIKGKTAGCEGETLEFFEDEGTNLTYQWTVNENPEIASADQNVNVVVGQAQTVELLVLNAIGCPSSQVDQVTITNNSPEGFITISDTIITSGDLVTLDFEGTDNVQVTWSYSNGSGGVGTEEKQYFYSDSVQYLDVIVELLKEGCTTTNNYDSAINILPKDIDLVSNNNHQAFTGVTASENLFIYPIPAQNSMTIDYPNGNLSDLKIVITDIYGHALIEQSPGESGSMNLSSLSAGTYILTVKGKNIFETIQLIKN